MKCSPGRTGAILSILLSILMVAGPAALGWNSFRGDPSNTGRTTTDLSDPLKGEVFLSWEFRADSSIGTAVIAEEGWCVFGTSNGTVYKLNSEFGSLEWSYNVGAPIFSTPLYIEETNDLAVCDSSGMVTALSMEEGAQLWTFDTGSGKEIISSPNGPGDMIYFGSYDSKFYSLKPDGTPSWDYIGCQGWIHTTPAVHDNNLYFGSCDGMLRCLDALTGEHKWNFSAAYIPSSPAIMEGRIYFGSYDSNMYCLDAGDGELIWSTALGGDIQSSPAVNAEKVMVGANDGLLYCLDAEYGSIEWTLDLGPSQLETSPVIGGKLVYATCEQGLVMVHMGNGSIYRSFEYGDASEVSPSAYGSKVFFGDRNGYVRCLRQNIPVTDDDDGDDAFDIGREVSANRDMLFLALAVAIIIGVILAVFWKRYRRIRKG
ncbi:MAG: PQQ-binding-like beta-propeller repeat protein [Thermoplasmatota archaeon]